MGHQAACCDLKARAWNAAKRCVAGGHGLESAAPAGLSRVISGIEAAAVGLASTIARFLATPTTSSESSSPSVREFW